MVGEAIERVCRGNLPPCSANVKLPIGSGSNGDLSGKQKPWLEPGLEEDGIWKIEN
jgi:hypothetical protein